MQIHVKIHVKLQDKKLRQFLRVPIEESMLCTGCQPPTRRPQVGREQGSWAGAAGLGGPGVKPGSAPSAALKKI